MDHDSDTVRAWRRLNSVEAIVIDLRRWQGNYGVIVESDLGRRAGGFGRSIAAALLDAAHHLGYRVDGDRLRFTGDTAA